MIDDEWAGQVGAREDVCEHKNATWAYPCGRPAKATVTDGSSKTRGKRLCGIHARSWRGHGWKVEADA